jgi:glutamate dehydrogenase (NADP+)
VTLVAEGANMPTDPDGGAFFLDSLRPEQGASSGGVAGSGLEMAQESQRLQWSRWEVDDDRRSTMRAIHAQVREAAGQYGQEGNYVAGASIAGFRRVADAMLDQSGV